MDCVGVIKSIVSGAGWAVRCSNRHDDSSVNPNIFGCSSAAETTSLVEVTSLVKKSWYPTIGEDLVMGPVIRIIPTPHLALVSTIAICQRLISVGSVLSRLFCYRPDSVLGRTVSLSIESVIPLNTFSARLGDTMIQIENGSGTNSDTYFIGIECGAGPIQGNDGMEAGVIGAVGNPDEVLSDKRLITGGVLIIDDSDTGFSESCISNSC